ncbi:MAG TPA: histidine phosphatase family protein [Candidatus Dormibacteraeota bacterium]|nr:histidine phosphatase family protein [Candidatus Dormibacteraeota bacterium]
MNDDGHAPARTRLFLVRHCDVFNPDGVLYGHLPGFRLSDRGVRQAHSLGRRLAGEPIRQIYVSPLQRAQETASIIASYLPGVEVTTTEELVEARFGHYLEGVRPRDVIWRRPLWLVHMARPGLLPGDESVPELAARVRAPLERLLRDHPSESGICVTHGDPIQGFWVEADGRSPFALHRLQCMKGGMLVLDYASGRLVEKTYVPPEEVADEEVPTSSRSTTRAGAVAPSPPGSG